MPLYPGKKNVGRNIKSEIAHGKSKKQSIAIAFSVARKSGADIPKKRSGHQVEALKRKMKK